MLKENLCIADGTEKVIKKLSEKYRIGLASSASPENVDLFLNKSGLRSYFNCIINGTMVNKAKPAPDIYLAAVEKLNVKKEECVVVEDAVSGIKSAKNAGLTVFAVSGTDSIENLTAAGADKIINSLKELLEKYEN
ncbi:HAD-IA family hydrolase [Candidatus Dependentiae bacterium]|nr:HAD-IA family hydrolase [Candidatus Dependentiae bacterium]